MRSEACDVQRSPNALPDAASTSPRDELNHNGAIWLASGAPPSPSASSRRWNWHHFMARTGKALWELVKVIIVPAVLVFGVWWLNGRQATVATTNAQNQARDTVLDAYLSEMADLMLKYQLGPHARPSVPTIARARTLTALRRLDPDRQATLMRFLSEARLLPVVDLRGANLTRVGLNDTNLSGARLHDARLSGALLRYALLRDAGLSQADLSGVMWNHTLCPDGTKSDGTGTGSCRGHLTPHR